MNTEFIAGNMLVKQILTNNLIFAFHASSVNPLPFEDLTDKYDDRFIDPYYVIIGNIIDLRRSYIDAWSAYLNTWLYKAPEFVSNNKHIILRGAIILRI